MVKSEEEAFYHWNDEQYIPGMQYSQQIPRKIDTQVYCIILYTFPPKHDNMIIIG